MASLLPSLRGVAPRLTGGFFQCSHHRSPSSLGVRPLQTRESSPRSTGSFTTVPFRSSETTVNDSASSLQAESGLASLGTSIGKDGRKTKKYFFPRTSEKVVAYWLLGSAASVFGIVVFGGLTRLTESGYVAVNLAYGLEANFAA